MNVLPCPTITLAGVTIPLGQAILLSASTTLNRFDSFKVSGVAYQVPTGRTLVMVAIKASILSGSFGVIISTATASCFDTVGAPAGNTTINAGGQGSTSMVASNTVGADNTFQLAGYSFAAGSYPTLSCSVSAGQVFALGYLI